MVAVLAATQLPLDPVAQPMATAVAVVGLRRQWRLVEVATGPCLAEEVVEVAQAPTATFPAGAAMAPPVGSAFGAGNHDH